MASTAAGSGDIPIGPSQVLGSDTVDRTVFLYVTDGAQMYVGFSAAGVGTTSSPQGFIVPRAGIRFKLQAGDELHVLGLTNGYPRKPYFSYIATKV